MTLGALGKGGSWKDILNAVFKCVMLAQINTSYFKRIVAHFKTTFTRFQGKGDGDSYTFQWDWYYLGGYRKKTRQRFFPLQALAKGEGGKGEGRRGKEER